MMTKRGQPAATEVDTYVFIKENLRTLGWDTRNPSRMATGQVYTQNECLNHPEIKRQWNLDRPENVVKVTEAAFWVIEAKRTHGELGKALREAEEYATRLNASRSIKAVLVSGVAGNELDTFLIRSRLLVNGRFEPIKMNSVEVSGLLSPSDCDLLLRTGNPNIENPPIDEKLFIARAEQINEILHLGSVNPHQRASVMSALLLSMLSSTGPNIEERSPVILIEDINSRVRSVLRDQGKQEFQEYIRICIPATRDNHAKFRKALVDTIQELNNLNIRSAMNSGADWLGAFYEVFLKYASWAQDLGIVLTPRHTTTFVADVMGIRPMDIVYDPTCGTGGFLVAAFDAVKRAATSKQLASFKKNSVFGIEQDSGVAALAVVNMIFRGDGKNNIHEGNCFAKFLEHTSTNGQRSARFVATQSDEPPVTKVMMNPPFSLKRSDEKEYKFIEQALNQMEDGGTLFSVLPYAAMVRPGGYRTWRRNQLLAKHTLLAVLTFAGDLFYPVGVTTCGIFVRKGKPHDPRQKVLWIRALNDGLLKSKGKRLPNPKAPNDLASTHDLLKAFLADPTYRVPNVNQFTKATPIDLSDKMLELVPEAFLDQARPTHADVLRGMHNNIRDLLAYLVKIDRAILKPELLVKQRRAPSEPEGWSTCKVTELFDLERGDFHSIADLDVGTYPTISRVGADNGLVGFYDIPESAKLWPAKTITVSSVTGDTFIQPVPFIATDNVVLCVLKEAYRHLSLPSLVFVQYMIDQVKWRYSYGRQCYRGKFAVTEIVLPTNKGKELDQRYMGGVVKSALHWPLVNEVFSSPEGQQE